jgi:hypothetical protein
VTGDGVVFGYQGHYVSVPPKDPPGWVDGAPTSGERQHCALCRSPSVTWVHPLNPDLVTYREYGKGHTLPTYWCLCGRCEDLYQAGAEAELVAIMQDAWQEVAEHVDECIRKPLAVFRRADRGARELE